MSYVALRLSPVACRTLPLTIIPSTASTRNGKHMAVGLLMHARMKQAYVPTRAGIQPYPVRTRARSQQRSPPSTKVVQRSSFRLAIHATASTRWGWRAQNAVRRKAATSAAEGEGERPREPGMTASVRQQAGAVALVATEAGAVALVATEAGAVALAATFTSATSNHSSNTAFSAWIATFTRWCAPAPGPNREMSHMYEMLVTGIHMPP